MVKTYHDRSEESTRRLALRSTAQSFSRIIEEGTNCSLFEASVIADKAQEVFKIGDYREDQSLQPGQMIWQAISEDEPPGKPLKECVFKKIRLTVHSLSEDMQVRKEHGLSAKRGQQIMRITQESLDQRALLTQEDLAILLDSDIKTIRTDIKRYQKEYEVMVPTRGSKKDIGPGLTHREKVVVLFIQGKDTVAIARDLKHSLRAVERYVHTFCRVIFCQEKLNSTLKTAMVVGISVSAVNRYLDLKAKYWNNPQYQERLTEIEKMGSQYWECQDGKKKPGQTKRRRK